MSTRRIQLYVSRWCVQCRHAVSLLERRGLPYEAIDLADLDGCCRLHELTGGRSVPQAIVDGRRVGGYDELAALLRKEDLQVGAVRARTEP
jgi:glutaredoxin 3